MAVADDIEQFYGYFTQELTRIGELASTLHRKILLAIMLDTLARARFPNAANNKERFLNFVRSDGNWLDLDRVSLPHLAALLAERPTAAGGSLHIEAKRRLGKWGLGQVLRLDADPRFDELLPYAKAQEERQVLEQSRHAELLYTYRNHLIHEFREPGHAMEFSDDNASPYYHGMSDPATARDTWELVYPMEFFTWLVESALNGLRRYLYANNLNPFDFYDFGSPWRKR